MLDAIDQVRANDPIHHAPDPDAETRVLRLLEQRRAAEPNRQLASPTRRIATILHGAGAVILVAAGIAVLVAIIATRHPQTNDVLRPATNRSIEPNSTAPSRSTTTWLANRGRAAAARQAAASAAIRRQRCMAANTAKGLVNPRPATPGANPIAGAACASDLRALATAQAADDLARRAPNQAPLPAISQISGLLNAPETTPAELAAHHLTKIVAMLETDSAKTLDKRGQPTGRNDFDPETTTLTLRTLATDLGPAHDFVVAFSTPTGRVCTIDLFGGGCFDSFPTSNPIIASYARVGTATTYVTGIVPDAIVSLSDTVNGTTSPLPLHNNAFADALPHGATKPDSYTATLTNGETITFPAR